MRKAELTRAVQHRAKRQAFIDTGCAAPWKVTYSSPDSDGRTARGGPHILVPPESSVTLVAIAFELAAFEVVEDGFPAPTTRPTAWGPGGWPRQSFCLARVLAELRGRRFSELFASLSAFRRSASASCTLPKTSRSAKLT